MASRQRRRRHERRREHARQGGLSLRRSVLTGAGVTAGAVLGLSSPALAESIQVTELGDAGVGGCDSSCTLREAISAANGTDGYDVVYFQSGLTGTVTLTGGQILVTDEVA